MPDTLCALKNASSSIFLHLAAFSLPTTLGLMADYLLGSKILWSCLAVEMLFVYLFILRQNADIDPLTKLNNRRSLDEYLDEIARESKRETYSFIMMDLNQFKQINDQFGHFEGDKVLRNFSDILNASVRNIDFAARFGGDEFCVIARGMQDPSRLVKRIKDNLEAFNRKKGKQYVISFSNGSAVYLPDDERTPREFLEYVDTLLYADKSASSR